MIRLTEHGRRVKIVTNIQATFFTRKIDQFRHFFEVKNIFFIPFLCTANLIKLVVNIFFVSIAIMCAQQSMEYDKLITPSEMIETLESVLGELDGKITTDIQPLRHFMEVQQRYECSRWSLSMYDSSCTFSQVFWSQTSRFKSW